MSLGALILVLLIASFGLGCALVALTALFTAAVADAKEACEAWIERRAVEARCARCGEADAYRVVLGLADELARVDEFDVPTPLVDTGVAAELEVFLSGKVER